jgi:hypothetical protein
VKELQSSLPTSFRKGAEVLAPEGYTSCFELLGILSTVENMAAGLQEFSHRATDGGPLLEADDEEVLQYTQPRVAITFGEARQEEIGTLYITTRYMVWIFGFLMFQALRTPQMSSCLSYILVQSCCCRLPSSPRCSIDNVVVRAAVVTMVHSV